MKGTVRSNNQSRKQGTPEVSRVKGREGGVAGPSSAGNASKSGNTGKPRELPHPSGGKPVKPAGTSDLSRKPTKVGSVITPNPEQRKACGVANVISEKPEDSGGSPARSQTPKLERHFSFEEEEDCVMVTSVPPQRTAGGPTGKEKPVKPARKNLPKVGSPRGSPPALKRRLNVPAESNGINSIFSAGGPSGAPGALRCRPSPTSGSIVSREGGKVNPPAALLPSHRVKTGKNAVGKCGNVARGVGDITGDVTNRPHEGNAGLVLGSCSSDRAGITQDGGAPVSERLVCDNSSLRGGSEVCESGSSAASPESVKSQILCFSELKGQSTPKSGSFNSAESRKTLEQTSVTNLSSHENASLDSFRPTIVESERKIIDEGERIDPNLPEDSRTCSNFPEDTRTCPNLPEDTRTCPNLPEDTRTRPSVPEHDRPLPNLPERDRTRPIITRTPEISVEEPPEYARLISQDSGVSLSQSLDVSPSRNMLLEADNGLSCLSRGRTEEIRCCQIPSERFYGEFGDVSDDIGLERLATLYGVGERSPLSARVPSPSGYANPEPYILNNGGRFNLVGEFGDVSEDLGAGRFPSLPPRSRDSSLCSDEAPREEGAEAPGGGPVLDFSGLSADSGLEGPEEDMYEYDEDFALEDAGKNLDEELILEVLCANRVDQMTRTYNDIEAVSRLLEEKEKDLELTARIGKELLDQNQGLKVRLAAIEVELRTSHEENTQLKHELQQKTQLLHALTSDEDGSPHDHPSPLVSPSCGTMPPLPPHHLVGGRTSARAGVELLKRRIAWLEDENKSLRVEASQLARDTQRVEEEEAKLVEGVTQQLASVSEESRLLSEELERVRNEGGRQREEVDALLDKLDAAQDENKRLRLENEELSSLVMITKENQDRLTTELADFKERYGEVMCLLTEAQENLRKVRQKELPSALAGNRYLAPPVTTHHSLQSHYGDSIALELESSLNYGLSLDSGIHMPSDVSPKAPHYRKVFETVRSASRSSGSPSPSPLHHQRHPSLGGSTSSFAQLSTTATLSSASPAQACRMSTRASLSSTQGTPQAQHGGYNPRGSIFSETPRHLYGALPSTGFHSMDSAGQSEESDHSEILTDSEDCLYPMTSLSGAVRDGVPGTPGAKELQAALVRIAKQQQMSTTKGEKAIGGYEGKSREPSLDASSLHRWSISSSLSSAQNQQLPYGCRTPDSIMSTGSSRGSSTRSWRMPEKLQIVKPLEGSLTLGWWSKLATPSLSAALEERPGVKVRGGGAGDGVTQHTLLDVEEDDSVSITSTKEAPMHPGKFFQGTGSVYTYTNSTVLHPDNTVPPSPMPQSPVTSSPSQPTPQLLSRRSSISTATPTFSTALGLAKMLRERGISASSSTEDLNSISGAHFTSATATPCNSPDDSIATTRSPSPELYKDGDDGNPIANLISSGAELLRRSLAGSLAPIPGSGAAMAGKRQGRPPLSRSDQKALVEMKLVEKLERIGVESIVAYPIYRPLQGGLVPLTTTLQVGTMYARPAVKSPMAQLTSLKSTLRSRSLEGNESGSESSVVQEAVVQKRRRQLQPRRRQDLGTVPQLSKPKKKSVTDSIGAPATTRGTISAIFFGRKGGLM